MTATSDFVFMTGASGFVGSHVVAQLLRDRAKKPWGEIKALAKSAATAEKLLSMGVTPVLGDLLDEGGEWRRVAANARWVVSCAQPAQGAGYALRPKMDQSLLRAIDPQVTRRAVFVFGTAYFGRTGSDGSIDETVRPRRAIGNGPLFEPTVEALRAAGRDGLDYAAAFLGGAYGPGSWFVGMYADAILRGEPIMLRDPSPVWPYVHVEDCARAIEFLLLVSSSRLDANGREVIVTDDQPAPMEEFITRLAERLDRRPILSPMDDDTLRATLPPALYDYMSSDMIHSNARLRKLGFECRYPHIRDGIPALDLKRG